MAGGKGKDTFRAESISSVCSVRCCDLWWHYSPRQGSGEDLDGTQHFTSLGKPGGGEADLLLWAMGCGSQGFSSTQNHSDMAGPWGGSCLNEGPKMLLRLQRLSLREWLFGEEKWGMRMGVSGRGFELWEVL